MMKRFFTSTALFLWPLSAALAQVGTPQNGFLPDERRAPYRTEFISYGIRDQATAGVAARSQYYRALDFKKVTGADDYEATVTIPGLWLDRDVYIRDTGRSGRYLLTVNGRRAGYNTDSYGTGEWHITPLLTEGRNVVAVRMLAPETAGGDMESFTPPLGDKALPGIYLFSQPRIHIFDYTALGRFDAEFKDNVIDLAVVVVNGFNMPEDVRVGYDVYDPAGKLVDFSYKEATIRGRGADTVRIVAKIVRAERNQYSAANPRLYRVTLSLTHGGRATEYIPFKLGFGLTTYDGERVSRGGQAITVKSAEGDYPVRAGTLEKLRALKRRGVNTVAVTRQQQKWFYDMAAAEGLWVIDRADVECDPRGGDRTTAGTVANDPEYLPRFLDREAAMYYRNRNYPNIIGWSIGSESGNGYNMYKGYELLKSLDPTRPAIYPWAEGEFNTDEY